MRKTTLVIDDHVLEQAREILGTQGVKDTIDRALEEVIRTSARRALIERLTTLEGLDLTDEEVTRAAWED